MVLKRIDEENNVITSGKITPLSKSNNDLAASIEKVG